MVPDSERAVCRHAAQRQAALEARQTELVAAQGGSRAAGTGSDFRELLQLCVAAVVHKVGTGLLVERAVWACN